MSLLLVDIGNSRVKWAKAGRDEAEWLAGAPFPSRHPELPDGLERCWGALPPPRAVYAANVTGPENEACLAEWVRRRWGSPVRWIRSEAEGYGVVNGYAEPARLGVDRWAALVAVRDRFALPACVVDCGTALTLDVLDHAGRHLGGWIMPGLALMRRALRLETQGISALGSAELSPFPPEAGAGAPFSRLPVLGTTTANAVGGGVVRACSGLIEKTVGEFARRFEQPLGLILTGGDGVAVGRDLAIPYLAVPDLVLWGLLVIARGES